MGNPPNILILITDQQTHDLMSNAGTTWVSTPHLDRLARAGARFTRAFCSNPVCVPSRFSMFTGRMPSAIGLRGNDAPKLHPFTVAHDQTGLGHQLRQGGYTTWYGGKVHWPIGLTPARLGFTTYSTDERERLAIDAADLIHRSKATRWATVVSLINPHDICYLALRAFSNTSGDNDRQIMARAANEIAALDEALLPPTGIDREHFLRDMLPPLPANHDIQRDEPSMIGDIIGKRPFRDLARKQWSATDWRLHRWAYARLMERVDRQIGVVLDALHASGQADNTLVIMTSDHGDHGSSHRLEHKTILYDEAVRVPWIMRWPGRIPAGRVVDDSLINTGLDLMATVCAAAEVPLPNHCLGVNALPAATGNGSGREHVFAENVCGRMVCTRGAKLVLYDRGTHHEQLYDLRADPGETANHLHNPSLAPILSDLRQRLAADTQAHAGLALGPLFENASRE